MTRKRKYTSIFLLCRCIHSPIHSFSVFLSFPLLICLFHLLPRLPSLSLSISSNSPLAATIAARRILYARNASSVFEIHSAVERQPRLFCILDHCWRVTGSSTVSPNTRNFHACTRNFVDRASPYGVPAYCGIVEAGERERDKERIRRFPKNGLSKRQLEE